MNRRTPLAWLLSALVLASCAAGPPAAPPLAPTALSAPLGTVSVRIEPDAFEKSRTYRLQGKAFDDHRIAYLRLKALGADMSPVESIVPWAPPLGPVTLSLTVPQGPNRVFLLSGLNYARQPIITFKGMASVATSPNTVTVHAGTTPAADALERVILEAPSVAPAVDLGTLQGFLDDVTGYDAAARSYDFPPGKVDVAAIAQAIVASAGLVPTVPASYRSGLATLAVAPVDAGGTAIASGVTLVLSDPVSADVVTASSVGTISSAARGRWVLTATHPRHGAASVAVEVPYASGTLSVALTPHATGVASVGTQEILFPQVDGIGVPVDGDRTSGRFTASAWRESYAAPVACDGTWAYVGEQGLVRLVNLSTGALSTLAGAVATGTVDGTGTSARFSEIADVVCDASGTTLYVADGNRIRRITRSTGQVVTLAGAVASGNTDDSLALNARFDGPRAVALNPAGTILYVADTLNSSIRRVYLPSGPVDTVSSWTAGTPIALAVSGSGMLYVATSQNELYSLNAVTPGSPVLLGGSAANPGGFQDGAAPSIRFNWRGGNNRLEPVKLLLSTAGDLLYLTDLYNHRIRRVDGLTTTAVVSTVLGDGVGDYVEGQDPRVLGPAGLAWAGSDLLYFDLGNARLRRHNLTTRVSTRVVGGGRLGFRPGPVRQAAFIGLQGLALDPTTRRAYALEPYANRVLAFDLEEGSLDVLAGSGVWGDLDAVAGEAQFRLSDESGLEFDAVRQALYVTEPLVSSSWRIRKLDLAASPVRVTTLASSVSGPEICLDQAGNTLFTRDGSYDLSTGSPSLVSYTTGFLTGKRLLGVTATHLYAAKGSYPDYDQIVRYARPSLTTEEVVAGVAGSPGVTNGALGTGKVKGPQRVRLDPRGEYAYFLEHEKIGLRRVDLSNGTIEAAWPSGESDYVNDLAFDTDGTMMMNVSAKRLVRLRF